MRLDFQNDSGNRPRVVIRADADSLIGFGHFVRMVALASYLRHDFDCLIATRNSNLGQPSDWQKSAITESGARLMPIFGRDLTEFDSRFAQSLMPDDLVVLDNYYFPTDWQRNIRDRVKALVCIDDLHDRHFVSDVVMTVCPLTRSDFSLEDYTQFYGGVDRAFLREPFLAPFANRKKKTDPSRVAVAMGGADPFRLTDMAVRVLRHLLPESRIDVIAGQSVMVENMPGVHIWRQADAARIVSIFDHADFGVFPASTVCVEAFARRLPVAAGYYVDNQKDFYETGVTDDWFAPLGWLPDGKEALEQRLRRSIERGFPTPPVFDFVSRRREVVQIFKQLSVKS